MGGCPRYAGSSATSLADGKASLHCPVLVPAVRRFGRRGLRGNCDGRPTSDSLVHQPHHEGLVLTKDERQALIDDVIAARLQIPAIMLQGLEHLAIEPDGDLITFLLGLLRNDSCHGFYS